MKAAIFSDVKPPSGTRPFQQIKILAKLPVSTKTTADVNRSKKSYFDLLKQSWPLISQSRVPIPAPNTTNLKLADKLADRSGDRFGRRINYRAAVHMQP